MKKVSVVAPVAVMMVKSDRHKLDSVEDISIGAAPVSAELESMLRRRFKGLKQTRQGLKNSHVQKACRLNIIFSFFRQAITPLINLR